MQRCYYSALQRIRYTFSIALILYSVTFRTSLRCVSAAVIFVVVSIVAAARSSEREGAITAAVLFGFLLVGVFCYDAYITYKTEITDQAAEMGDGEQTLST
ncbi:hypothetical protein GDO81_001752 [Engystomops pustulosus]|uniref:Uncharacterized protein n=1 Tax=Engystomops pustulosus TaxID=76066 RepID=A0AAV7DHH7_ENGPU|nr:hypothetical protein GDO81_001752 [Engystomops pustulosus]